MTDLTAVNRQFAAMGALLVGVPHAIRRSGRNYSIDVVVDRRRRRESFVVRDGDTPIELEVVNSAPTRRHLLLMVKVAGSGSVAKHLYLCGHDERHWFVAAVPPIPHGVTTVESALEALKPQAVRLAQAKKSVSAKKDTGERIPPSFGKESGSSCLSPTSSSIPG